MPLLRFGAAKQRTSQFSCVSCSFFELHTNHELAKAVAQAFLARPTFGPAVAGLLVPCPSLQAIRLERFCMKLPATANRWHGRPAILAPTTTHTRFWRGQTVRLAINIFLPPSQIRINPCGIITAQSITLILVRSSAQQT